MGGTHVVVVVIDTARVDSLLNIHHEPAFSSAIVEITATGSKYSSAFAVAPWTLPSHASLFTGTSPSKHGAHAGHKQLTGQLRTLAEVFQSAGHETVAVSNNTWISEEFGFGRGFETFHKNWQYVQSDVDFGDIAQTKEGFDKILAAGRRGLDGNPLVNVINAIYGQFVRDQANDDGARSTNEWVSRWLTDRNSSDPFFLFINYFEPHLEYRPPREYAERFLPRNVTYDEAMEVNQDAWRYIAGRVEMTDYDFEILRALYHAEIAYLDERIGELRRILEDAGEWDDTIFVVTGDHGENIGDHELMDHQYCLYDTLLHVPLIVHGGSFTGGKTVDDLVQLTDISPTLLDATGIDAPEFRSQTQGRSFYPTTNVNSREYVIGEYMSPQPSMEALKKRVGDFSESTYEYDRSLRSIRTDRWKFIRGSDGTRELYDIENDPKETRDLATDRQHLVQGLSSQLDDWIDSFDHAEHSGNIEIREETKARLEDLGYLH
jgi:arylsulfatase A-like enzyme